MNLKTTVRVFEIAASIAVLITLVVLVFEIRENTETIKRSTYESLSDRLIDWRLLLTTEPELHRIFYQEVLEGDGKEWNLQMEDRHKFLVFMQALWQIYEQAFYAHLYGDLEDTEWGRFKVRICEIPTPAYVWDTPRSGIKAIMSPRFIEFVEKCRPSWGDT